MADKPTFWTYLIRFLMYNFVGALLPMAISLIIRYLASSPSAPGIYAPELLFFAVMISATALGDVTDETKIIDNTPTFQFIKGALLFGAIAVAAIYGMYQYDSIVGPGNTKFRENITKVTLILSFFLFVTSLLAEILIAKIRTETP